MGRAAVGEADTYGNESADGPAICSHCQDLKQNHEMHGPGQPVCGGYHVPAGTDRAGRTVQNSRFSQPELG